MSNRIQLLAVCCVMLLHGCAAERPTPRDPPYSIAFHNGTAFQLFEVEATFPSPGQPGQSYKLTAGPLAPGVTKAQHEERDPIPETATVSWETATGQKRSEQIAITPALTDPAGFRGTIYFKFTYDGVQLVPLTDAERRRRAELRQEYP